METYYTKEFIWRNGTLMQKVLTLKGGTDLDHEWETVTVGGKPVKDPTFKTFQQRSEQVNGKEPQAKRAGWDHVIEFDGGTSCNMPGKFGEGYGSYQIDGGEIKRVNFGKGHSNNSAEMRTLIEALKDLRSLHIARRTVPGTVLCRGDSMIALKWIRCTGKPSRGASQYFLESIELLREEVKAFAKVKGEWRRRTHSVKLFGH